MTALIVHFPQQCRPSFSGGEKKIRQCSTAGSSRQRRVSFHHKADVVYIENVSLFEAKPDLWFSEKDVQAIKYGAAMRLQRIKSKMTMAKYVEMHSDDTSKFLGFHNYLTKSGCKKIQERRRRICEKVKIEQERQARLGTYDPDAMANVSQAASSASYRRARIVGLLHCDVWPGETR